VQFTEDQTERYSRHILLPDVGGQGQARLMAASAFVVGAGGLGSPALLYLAAAGVGRIGILDGSDNFPTRFLVADACWLDGVPLVSAAVVRFEGQLMTVLPAVGNPCYRCFLPEPPPPEAVPTCQQAGVLGPLAGAMGALQATEALKLLLGVGDLLSHAVVVLDALDWSFLVARRAPNPARPLCGEHPTIREVREYEAALCCPGGRCDGVPA
jgi:molybdopterin/thiamine biosynthesis adenylyltransferase